MLTRPWLLLALATTLVCGCEAKDEESDTGEKKVYWPEKDVTSDGEALWGGMQLDDNVAAGSGKWNNTIWLNFEGATVTSSESFIVGNAGVTEIVVPPFAVTDLGPSYADQDRDQIKSTVLELTGATLGGLDLSVVLTQPDASIPYTTMHIGGPNFTGRDGVLGTAPLDAGNFSGTDIGFIYAQEFAVFDNIDSAQILANVIAHEVSHSLGARHINSETALMFSAVGVENAVVNVEANYPGENEGEHTFNLLAANVGLAENAAAAITAIPELVNLSMKSTGDVAQISVISPENVAQNPGVNLVAFDYSWSVSGLTLTGPSIRLRFAEPGQEAIVAVTISHLDMSDSKTFEFTVIRASQE